MELPTTSINNDNATMTINNTGGSTRAASRKSRVYVFRKFVVETYRQYMTEVVKAREDTRRRSGGGDDDRSFFVLDVAGGNGDLSWLLNNIHEPMSTSSSTPTSRDLGSAEKSSMKKGLFSSSSTSPVSRSIPIHSTVVDPRGKTTNCRHIIKSVRYLQRNPEERKRRAIPGLPTHQPLALLIEQGKIRQCLSDPSNSSKSDGDSNCSYNKNDNDGSIGGEGEDSMFVTPEQIQIPLNDEFVNIIQSFQIIKERRGEIREKKQTEDRDKLRHTSRTNYPTTQPNHMKGDTIKHANASCSENSVGEIFNKGDEFHTNPLAFITTDELNKWRNFFQNQQKKISKIDGSNNINKRKRSSGDDSRVDNDPDVSPSMKSSAVAIDDDADKALELILKTDLICGFHPDQATDSCIDLGDVLGVPVAVVPCCVFPYEFPDRRVFDTAMNEEVGPDDANNAAGEKVRTYTQLIHYLQQKCPHAKRAELPFSFTQTAKNIVLYTFEERNHRWRWEKL